MDGLIEVTPSWTTRPPRPEELYGCVEHRFITEAECDALEARAFFLKCVRMFGLPYRYGLPPVQRPQPGRVPLVMVRARLLPLLREYYEQCVVYQVEDLRDRVLERVGGRGANPHEVGSRLADFDAEIEMGRMSAKRVFTNSSDIESVTRQVRDAVRLDFGSYIAAEQS
jgi:guanylate kinase